MDTTPASESRVQLFNETVLGSSPTDAIPVLLTSWQTLVPTGRVSLATELREAAISPLVLLLARRSLNLALVGFRATSRLAFGQLWMFQSKSSE